ncbi:MAG: carboxypeptidase regulatory-like domain-containing protein [Planctomycetes bacterium]|nr:carboxypeptidase regulatory-like domain-containing protein [Planctomycetota bacterium]
MSKGGLRAAIAAVILIAAAAVLWILVASDSETAGRGAAELAPPPVTTAVTDAAGAAPASSEQSGAASRAAAAPEAAKLPEAYEKALSGIVGRVVEPDGRPVPNAPVELLGGLIEFFSLDLDQLLFQPDTLKLDLTAQKRTTDAEGRFRFERVDPRGYFLVGVNLGGRPRPALALVDRAPQAGETVDLGDIRLDPWLTLTGRLVDESMRPHAGAQVRVTNAPPIIFQAGLANLQPGTALLARMGPRAGTPKILFQLPRWTDQIFEKLPTPMATTDAEGRFRIEGAPSGALSLVATGSNMPGFAQPLPATKQSERDLGEIVAARGETVEGVVVDEQGAAVAGASVMIGMPSPLAADFVAFLKKPVLSGADGRFRVPGIGGSKAVWVARAPNVEDWTVGSTFDLDGEEVRVVVPAARSILVRVLDDRGKPLAATLAVQRAVEGLSLVPQIEPPLRVKPEPVEAGASRVRGLNKGKYWVYARAPGFAVGKETAAIEESGEPEVRITLEREFTVEATVLGKVDGKPSPLEAATVFGGPDRGFESLGFMALGSSKTDAAGIAQVRALGQGKFNLIATHPAYASGWVQIEIPGTRTATVQLVVGGTVEGRVHRGGIPPETPLMVAIAPQGRVPQLPRTTVTGLEGGFKFTHLAPGNYRVVAMPRVLGGDSLTRLNPMDFMAMASDNASAPCEVIDEQTTSIDIDLTTGGRAPRPDDGFLRGRVTVNGLVPTGDFVTASGPDEVRPKAITAQGTFDLGRVAPGTYNVQLLHRGTTAMGPFPGALANRAVVVESDAETFVDLQIQTGRLSGVVVDEGGKTVANARIRALEKGSQFAWGSQRTSADDTGRFAFEEIAAGTYQITATAPDFADGVATVTIPARAETTKVEIRLVKGVSAEGTFEADLPEAARFGMMRFNRKEETDTVASMDRVNVDLEKRTFSTARLRPGSYRVSFQVFGRNDSRSYKEVDVEIPPGGTTGLALKFVAAPPGERPAGPPIFGGRPGR